MTGLEEPLGEAKLTASANGHSDHGSTNGVVNGDDNIDKDPLEEDLMEVPTFTAVRIPLKPNPGLVTSTIYFLSFLYLSKATSVWSDTWDMTVSLYFYFSNIIFCREKAIKKMCW